MSPSVLMPGNNESNIGFKLNSVIGQSIVRHRTLKVPSDDLRGTRVSVRERYDMNN